MTRRILSIAVCVFALAVWTAPAVAQDHGHGGGGGGDATGSGNLKLVSNVPRSAPATQSDLAFKGKLAIAGNYLGFRVIDISDPEHPTTVSDFRCNGAQSDVSVYGNLVFQSVDTPQTSGACNSSNTTASTLGAWEGVRIFSIADPAAPVHLASVATDCGSHTHTLVPDPANNQVFVYVSSYPLGAAAQGPNCRSLEGGGGHSKISIIRVPLNNPTAATVSPYFLDADTEWGTYLGSFTFRACHDISVFLELELAAAACLTEGQVWDISNPAAPEFRWRYDNPNIKPENIDLFHSAAFSWDGKIIAFGDESGGGTAARCADPHDNQGRIWFLDLATGEELASYKIPRAVAGVCTMHNFNFITRGDRNILVSSAYTGGTTVVDVDMLIDGHSEADSEVGFRTPPGGNSWSSYWYNGFIYSNDILRGLDIMLLSSPVRAGARKLEYMNPQTQEKRL